jgi:CCR4-NOT transcriptional regulation complex NOT5 subunit
VVQLNAAQRYMFIFFYFLGWCQRIKSEFKFEYAYLEDELGGGGVGSAGEA